MLNLEEELLNHYQTCVQARDAAMQQIEFGENLGSAASLLNATTSALKELVKLQQDLYNVERIKAIERVLIGFIKAQPDSVMLLAQLEKELGDA